MAYVINIYTVRANFYFRNYTGYFNYEKESGKKPHHAFQVVTILFDKMSKHILKIWHISCIGQK